MEGGAKVAVAIVFGLTMMTAMAVQGEANIDCTHVGTMVDRCLPYLNGGAADPATACCDGIKTLKSEAPTTQDRRAVCECLKAAASHFTGKIISERAVSLPKRCGVDIGVPISKDVKCSDIQ